MEDRFNTIAGWTLGAGILALGSTLFVGEIFKHEPLEHGGYPVVAAEGSGGGAAAPAPIDWSKADPVKGEEVFKQCMACHTATAGGANGTGPNLHGIVGKGKASAAGFAYSDGLKGMGGSWTFEDLDKWLASPRKFVTGTKMTFAGLSDPEKRASVIAYLNAQGSNMPMPKTVAPADAPAGPAASNAAEAAPAVNAAAPVANAAAPAQAK